MASNDPNRIGNYDNSDWNRSNYLQYVDNTNSVSDQQAYEGAGQQPFYQPQQQLNRQEYPTHEQEYPTHEQSTIEGSQQQQHISNSNEDPYLNWQSNLRQTQRQQELGSVQQQQIQQYASRGFSAAATTGLLNQQLQHQQQFNLNLPRPDALSSQLAETCTPSNLFFSQNTSQPLTGTESSFTGNTVALQDLANHNYTLSQMSSLGFNPDPQARENLDYQVFHDDSLQLQHLPYTQQQQQQHQQQHPYYNQQMAMMNHSFGPPQPSEGQLTYPNSTALASSVQNPALASMTQNDQSLHLLLERYVDSNSSLRSHGSSSLDLNVPQRNEQQIHFQMQQQQHLQWQLQLQQQQRSQQLIQNQQMQEQQTQSQRAHEEEEKVELDPSHRQNQILEKMIRSQNEMLLKEMFGGRIPVTLHQNQSDSLAQGIARLPGAVEAGLVSTGAAGNSAVLGPSASGPATGLTIGRLESSLRASRPPPRKKKVRPKDRPKRPLSAYNLFFQEERASMLAQLPSKAEMMDREDDADKPDIKETVLDSDGGVITSDKKRPQGNSTQQEVPAPKKRRRAKGHGKMGFEEMAKLIGAKWKTLDKERLSTYQEKSNKDRDRYQEEMEQYNQRKKMGLTKTGQQKMQSVLENTGDEVESLLGDDASDSKPASHTGDAKSDVSSFSDGDSIDKN